MIHSDTNKNSGHEDENFHKTNNGNPYDSENLDHESDSASKDITEQDIEEDLIHHDPSEGFATSIDDSLTAATKSESFETIGSDQDNPVNKEFEIGTLSNEEIKEDELSKDEKVGGSVPFNKPSERKF